MVIGAVHMLLFWGFIILVIVALVKFFFGASPSANMESKMSALEILKERYARGEIQREEYEQKKADLES